MSADENVKKIVGVPTVVIIALRSSFTLCQYEFVPAILATYLDTLDIKAAELLLSAISRNCSIVKCASPGFCFKNMPLCCNVLFLVIILKAQYANLGWLANRYTHLCIFSENLIRCLILSGKDTSLKSA